MTLYVFKPRFQALLRPLAGALVRAGVTANQVTLAAAGGSVLVGFTVVGLAEHRAIFLLLPIWLPLRMALNAIDGVLARDFNQRSALGAYLNEIGDVVSDAALIAPFAFLPPFEAIAVAAVILCATMTEFVGVLAKSLRASRRYDGPMGKSDRALVFGALGLWIGSGLPLPDWLAWLMPLMCLALIVTVVRRLRAGLAEAASAERALSRPDAV